MPILLDGQPLASLPSSSSLTSRQRSHSSTASSAAGHDIDHDSRMNGSDGSHTGTAIRLRPSGSSLADRSVHNGSKRANNGIVNTGSDAVERASEGSRSGIQRHRRAASEISTFSQRSDRPDYSELLASAMLPSNSKESGLSRSTSASHSVNANGSLRERQMTRSNSRASAQSSESRNLTDVYSDINSPGNSTFITSAPSSAMHSKFSTSASNTYSRLPGAQPSMTAMNTSAPTSTLSGVPSRTALPAIRGFTSFPKLHDNYRGSSNIPIADQPRIIGSISSANTTLPDVRADISASRNRQGRDSTQTENLSLWSAAFSSPREPLQLLTKGHESSSRYDAPADSYIASLGREPLYTRTNDGRDIVLPAPAQSQMSSPAQRKHERIIDSPKIATAKMADQRTLHNKTATVSSAPRSLKRRANSLGSSRRPSEAHVSADGTRRLSRSGRTTPTSHFRKESYTSSTPYSSSPSVALTSRFVRYDSRPDLFRLNTYKFGGTDARDERRDDADTEGDDTETEGPRELRKSRKSRATHSGTSVDHRRAEHLYQKLVTSRLPGKKTMTPEHRHDVAYRRAPSQPLGITWICGSRTAARSPSFYGEFEFQKIPGGKRRKSTGSRDVGISHSIDAQFSGRPSESSTVGRALRADTRAAEPATVLQTSAEGATPDLLKSSRDRDLPLLPLKDRTELADRTRRRHPAGSADENHTIITSTGLHISGPVQLGTSQTSDLIRTPRAAPLPDMDWPAETFEQSPLPPSRSDIRWVNSHRETLDKSSSDEESAYKDLENRRTKLLQALSPRLGPLVSSAASSRELVSAVLAEASEIAPLQRSLATGGGKIGIETPDERIPKSPVIKPMYTTGRIISSTVIPVEQASLHGSASPAFADLADFEASRIITGDIEWKSFPSPVLDRAALGQAAEARTPTHVRMSPGTLDKYIAKSQEGHISDAGHTAWTESLEGPYGSSPAMSSTESFSGGITPVVRERIRSDAHVQQYDNNQSGIRLSSNTATEHLPDATEDLMSSRATQPVQSTEWQPGLHDDPSRQAIEIESANGMRNVRADRQSLLSNDSHLAPSSVFTAQEHFEGPRYADSEDESPRHGRSVARDSSMQSQSPPDVTRRDTLRVTVAHPTSFLDISRSDLTLNRIRKRHPQDPLPDVSLDDLENLSITVPDDPDVDESQERSRMGLDSNADLHDLSDAESDSFATAESAYAPSQRMRSTSSNVGGPHGYLHEQPSFTSARTHMTQPANTVYSAYTPSMATVNTFYTATAGQERSDPFDTVPSLPTGDTGDGDRHGHDESPVQNIRAGSRNSFIDFDVERDDVASDQEDSHSFLDADSDDEDAALPRGQHNTTGSIRDPSSIPQAVRVHHAAHRPSVIVEQDTVHASSRDSSSPRIDSPDSGVQQLSLLSPASAYPSESAHTSGSDFVDRYLRGGSMGTSTTDASLLDIPGSPNSITQSGGRAHRASHAPSQSNVSLASDLSGIVDFPVPPTTTRSERTNPMDLIRVDNTEDAEDGSANANEPEEIAKAASKRPTFDTSADTLSSSGPAAVDGNRLLTPGQRFSFLDLSVSPERSPLTGERRASRFASMSPDVSHGDYEDHFDLGELSKQQRSVSGLSAASRERVNSDPSAYSHASWLSRQRASVDSAVDDDRRHSWLK